PPLETNVSPSTVECSPRPGRRAEGSGAISLSPLLCTGKKAWHPDRASDMTLTVDAAAGGAGGSLEPFRDRASRMRREPGWADEQDDAVFGALGARSEEHTSELQSREKL